MQALDDVRRSVHRLHAPAGSLQAGRKLSVPLPERVAAIDFAEFASRLRTGERRLPIDGVLETTFRCNLSCAHCYVNRPAGDRLARAQELPLARLLELVDEMAAAGCLSLVLSGGEVLVRPDFAPLYVHAVRRGLLVTVFTNGTLVDEATADLFDEHRPQAVEVTLYGMTPETYDTITGKAGAHARCLAGIRRLLARGLRVRLKTMVLRGNRHEVLAMEEFARGLGLEFRYDGMLNARVDGAPGRIREQQLAAEDLVALDRAAPQAAAELADFCARHVPREPCLAQEPLFVCGAGRTSFAVDPAGRLLPCLLVRRTSVDLRQASFLHGWRTLSSQIASRTWRRESSCRSCSLTALCGSCPGAAELETGDPEGVVATFCEVAHRRAAVFMGDPSGHRADASCCRPPAPGPEAAGAGCEP
ncbi:MAG TPA: radical SAM protein [Opitutaceae bacterium]|nr:radical SAM protein [Opitutaceae bacterium]